MIDGGGGREDPAVGSDGVVEVDGLAALPETRVDLAVGGPTLPDRDARVVYGSSRTDGPAQSAEVDELASRAAYKGVGAARLHIGLANDDARVVDVVRLTGSGPPRSSKVLHHSGCGGRPEHGPVVPLRISAIADNVAAVVDGEGRRETGWAAEPGEHRHADGVAVIVGL